ncbi:MAG: serine hydrolase [Bacteroidia bacterium]
MVKRLLIIILLPVLLMSGPAKPTYEAVTVADPEIPMHVDDASFQSLRSLEDNRLESRLMQKLSENPEWKGLIENDRMAVGLVDLRDMAHPRFAAINGNTMMYAASLPKIAILLTAMDALEKNELDETPEIKQDLRLMIAKSDNHASTRMIDRLGYHKIEQVLTDPRYALYDPNYGGGLWVGKRYAAEGERYPDPIKGLSHAASVTQVCRFYYMMIFGKLVSFERSRQMLSIMGTPELHHKFVNTLEAIAPSALLFRKSGSWQNYHSDSILVWDKDRKYILVGLTEASDGETILRKLVLSVEEVLN